MVGMEVELAAAAAHAVCGDGGTFAVGSGGSGGGGLHEQGCAELSHHSPHALPLQLIKGLIKGGTAWQSNQGLIRK